MAGTPGSTSKRSRSVAPLPSQSPGLRARANGRAPQGDQSTAPVSSPSSPSIAQLAGLQQLSQGQHPPSQPFSTAGVQVSVSPAKGGLASKSHLSAGGTQGTQGTFGQGRSTSGRSPSLRPEFAARHAGRRPNVTTSFIPLAGGSIPEGEDCPQESLTQVWGTTISTALLEHKIHAFLRRFRDPADPAAPGSMEDPEPGLPKYLELIVQALDTGDFVLNIDTADLRTSDMTLHDWLINFPREVMLSFDTICTDIIRNDLGLGDKLALGTPKDFICRPFNLATCKTIRDLEPSDVDRLISVNGMVTRASSIIPDLREAYFRCERCLRHETVPNDMGKIDEPVKCPECGVKFSMAIIHNLSTFTNKQLVKMQERPNDIPEGETPHAATLYVYESNVDVCRPGDRVTITGTYRAVPMRVNPRNRSLHALYKTYIDVTHIQRDEKSQLFTVAALQVQAEQAAEEAPVPGDHMPMTPMTPMTPAQDGSQSDGGPLGTPSACALSDQPGGAAAASGAAAGTGPHDPPFVPLGCETFEQLRAREEQIKALSRDPRLYERLVASLAPNIWEMDDIKKGALCQLFGGESKVFKGGRTRGEINVLVCGDPSVSKSQLLSYVHALAPRGIYTSGKGSSAVGLTAYVTRDPETKEMVLESGALVLSDRGICCIDEFDKMSDSARSMLHEAMEQQTISIAKAGLISTLNARTSILACANPINSRYNPSMSVAENINLPTTLLTRFDLIYLVLDKYDEERDRKLARHLVGLFHADGGRASSLRAPGDELLPKDLMRDYIAYARARIHPVLTDEASAALVAAYLDLRKDGRDRKVVVATPRQLESLIRLAEAQARMHLRSEVTAADVQEAVRLWYTAMQGSAGSDGGIDMEQIITGTNGVTRDAARRLPEDIRAVLTSTAGGRPISVEDLHSALQRKMAAAAAAGDPSLAALHITRQQVLDALQQLDDLVTIEHGVVRPRRGGAAT